MLASPIESAEEITGELSDFVIEDKFDGIRAHAHKDGGKVALFSRTLDDVTEQFPEVARGLADMESDGTLLLDGEIVAWQEDADRPASFFRLQRRLGRKAPDASLLEDIPTAFVAYDCLARSGRPLFEESWEARRRELVRAGLAGQRGIPAGSTTAEDATAAAMPCAPSCGPSSVFATRSAPRTSRSTSTSSASS